MNLILVVAQHQLLVTILSIIWAEGLSSLYLTIMQCIYYFRITVEIMLPETLSLHDNPRWNSDVKLRWIVLVSSCIPPSCSRSLRTKDPIVADVAWPDWTESQWTMMDADWWFQRLAMTTVLNTIIFQATHCWVPWLITCMPLRPSARQWEIVNAYLLFSHVA